MTSPGRSAGAGTSRRRSRASRLGWIAAGASLGLVIVAAWSWRDARPFGLVPIIGLPERIQLCGRSYDGGGGGPVQTVTEVRAIGGFEPVIVDPWIHPSCVPGACTTVALEGPCHTVVYVRVGRDEIVGYSLQGGP